MSPAKRRWALLSVSDKTGVVDLAQQLCTLGFHVLSTGGTAKLLSEGGVEVTEVAQYTGFPEMLDGRVKTLHPRIHAGLLARRSEPEHMRALTEQGIDPIEILVVNLYPFEQTVARTDCMFDDAIENIDIGGPAMLRAAAKNHQSVAVVVDPADYELVLDQLRNANAVDSETRLALAKKVFAHTAHYDGAIANYLTSLSDDGARQTFPDVFSRQWLKAQQMRYGENPHQQAAFYRERNVASGLLAGFTQLQGKELSYNNIADADAAWECVRSFDETACAIVKHANPCGVAIGADCRRRVLESAEDRSDVCVWRSHRVQPRARRAGCAVGFAPVRRGRHCAGVQRRSARSVRCQTERAFAHGAGRRRSQ